MQGSSYFREDEHDTQRVTPLLRESVRPRNAGEGSAVAHVQNPK